MNYKLFVFITLFFISGLFAQAQSDSPPRYKATIKWTSYGIPHIYAENIECLAFGQGYAFGYLNPCQLGPHILRVRSEMSMFFGEGVNKENIDSDFAYKILRFHEYARQQFSGLSSDAKEALIGYCTGYNYAVSEYKKSIHDLENPVFTAITPIDLLAYYLDVASTNSSRLFVKAMVSATHPLFDGNTPVQLSLEALSPQNLMIGSNGWAVGKMMASSKKGMTLANIHFPWDGNLKFYECHLQIPNVMNTAGASIYGFVGVQIGFNECISWTHTYSRANNFLLYQLRIVPGDPSSYYLDGKPEKFEKEIYSVNVYVAPGEYKVVTRTYYRSVFGPLIKTNYLDWNLSTAFALKDLNLCKTGLVNQILDINKSRNLNEFKECFKKNDALTWLHTICADKEGNVLYMNTSSIPRLSSDVYNEWKRTQDKNSFIRSCWENYRIPILYGTESTSLPIPSDTLQNIPILETTDYVANSNNSHWLVNVDQPLEGYSIFYGKEKNILSLRTRLSLSFLQNYKQMHISLSLEDMLQFTFSNQSMAALLIKNDLVQLCQKTAQSSVDSNLVKEIGAVLKKWDGTYNLDSNGSVLFREFMRLIDFNFYKEKFNSAKPLSTPWGIHERHEKTIVTLLCSAAHVLQTSHLPLDACLRDLQFVLKGSASIPMHGGRSRDGTFNIASNMSEEMPQSLFSSTQSNVSKSLINKSLIYPVDFGPSFTLGVTFTDNGPEAFGILAYSQSNQEKSPHFLDQTYMYSKKCWLKFPFKESEIEQDENFAIMKIRYD